MNSTANEPEEESDYSISFTPEQEDLFKKRFDEGYDLRIDPEFNAWLKINHPESLMDSSGSVVAKYLHITPLSSIPVDNEASSEVTHVPVESPKESVNALITTTPSESSESSTNVSIINETAENVSTLITAQDSVIRNQHTLPVTTTTVENHTQPTNSVISSSPTFLSRVLVDHTPKAI